MFANANSCSDDGEKKDKILKCQITNLEIRNNVKCRLSIFLKRLFDDCIILSSSSQANKWKANRSKEIISHSFAIIWSLINISRKQTPSMFVISTISFNSQEHFKVPSHKNKISFKNVTNGAFSSYRDTRIKCNVKLEHDERVLYQTPSNTTDGLLVRLSLVHSSSYNICH